METMIEPESWNDLDMDWTNPDPFEPCYYIAILKAMEERRKALASSGFTPWRSPEIIYRRNRFHIPTVSMMKKMVYDILHYTLTVNGRCIVLKDEFLHDETSYADGAPPSLQNWLTSVVTYPIPGIGSPISTAKDFLIWAKKILDTMTMYLYPFIRLNSYKPDEYAKKHPEKMYRDELEGITDKQERLDRLADLYINDYSDHFLIQSEVLQNIYIVMQTESDDYNGIASFSINLPESIEIRSFAKPHVYCLVKVMPMPSQLSSFYVFDDFGYGFEEGKNKILDLGQISEENGGKFDFFKFNLKDIKPHFFTGERIRHLLQANCYFALDYNCEGGFKFRPDE